MACVENLAGFTGHVNYDVIPGVIYTHPEAMNSILIHQYNLFLSLKIFFSLVFVPNSFVHRLQALARQRKS